MYPRQCTSSFPACFFFFKLFVCTCFPKVADHDRNSLVQLNNSVNKCSDIRNKSTSWSLCFNLNFSIPPLTKEILLATLEMPRRIQFFSCYGTAARGIFIRIYVDPDYWLNQVFSVLWLKSKLQSKAKVWVLISRPQFASHEFIGKKGRPASPLKSMWTWELLVENLIESPNNWC